MDVEMETALFIELPETNSSTDSSVCNFSWKDTTEIKSTWIDVWWLTEKAEKEK